jgi:hypothetical protein
MATSNNKLEELVLLSQRELLAQETLCDLLNEKTHHQTSSWASHVPPSRFTEQVLATLEDTQNGRSSNTMLRPLFDSRPVQQSEDEEEVEDKSFSDIDEETPQQMVGGDEVSFSNKTEQRVASPSPPSSPMSSSSTLAHFAQQITSLNLSSQQQQQQGSGGKSSLHSAPFQGELPPISHQQGSGNLIPILPLPIPASTEPFQREQSHSRPYYFHPSSERQALPLRRSMSSDTNRAHQNTIPMLSRKRPSSDSIMPSKGAHTSSSLHISSTIINPNHLINQPESPPPPPASIATHKNRQKKKRRRRDEIERKFTCMVGDCSKSYGSEGALKTHVKLKHPDVYVEQFSWSKGNDPPNYAPSSSPNASPVLSRTGLNADNRSSNGPANLRAALAL